MRRYGLSAQSRVTSTYSLAQLAVMTDDDHDVASSVTQVLVMFKC